MSEKAPQPIIFLLKSEMEKKNKHSGLKPIIHAFFRHEKNPFDPYFNGRGARGRTTPPRASYTAPRPTPLTLSKKFQDHFIAVLEHVHQPQRPNGRLEWAFRPGRSAQTLADAMAPEALKKLMRKAAQIFHPDVAEDKENAHDNMVDANMLREFLSRY